MPVKEENPATCPVELMAIPWLLPVPSNVPRSLIVLLTSFCQRTACSAPKAVVENPVTCPLSLIEKARLFPVATSALRSLRTKAPAFN